MSAEPESATAALRDSVPLEPSPAHTPLVPPPGTRPDGTVAAPPPTPKAEAAPLPPEPFADELPADFWGDDPLPPSDVRGAPDAAELPTSAPSAAGRPVEGNLEADPRFVLLTELFPGHVTSWQAAATETPAEGADDADGAPETVDLEEGLDADEAV